MITIALFMRGSFLLIAVTSLSRFLFFRSHFLLFGPLPINPNPLQKSKKNQDKEKTQNQNQDQTFQGPDTFRSCQAPFFVHFSLFLAIRSLFEGVFDKNVTPIS